jgi:NAD(P)-dependent dehydrogenase (short-subunit alcohol dehydrogenase family)
MYEPNIILCFGTLKADSGCREPQRCKPTIPLRQDSPDQRHSSSYTSLLHHLQTDTIGPIILAQRLLSSPISVSKIVFISSDSGSAQRFLSHEDGFAAYGASKAALNMMIRHMAAELERNGSETVVLALHPGEVDTDMARGCALGWEVEGQMAVGVSVKKCVAVIEGKGKGDSGTFWTWEDEVS